LFVEHVAVLPPMPFAPFPFWVWSHWYAFVFVFVLEVLLELADDDELGAFFSWPGALALFPFELGVEAGLTAGWLVLSVLPEPAAAFFSWPGALALGGGAGLVSVDAELSADAVSVCEPSTACVAGCSLCGAIVPAAFFCWPGALALLPAAPLLPLPAAAEATANIAKRASTTPQKMNRLFITRSLPRRCERAGWKRVLIKYGYALQSRSLRHRRHMLGRA
jgi:hypothetical protein